jgi:hypothetical protein
MVGVGVGAGGLVQAARRRVRRRRIGRGFIRAFCEELLLTALLNNASLSNEKMCLGIA